MNKKDFIRKLLLSLKNDRPIAQSLLMLLDDDVFDQEAVDALVHIFSESMKGIVDEEKRLKVQKGIQVLEHIKEIEENEREAEKKDLEDLEHLLDDLV